MKTETFSLIKRERYSKSSNAYASHHSCLGDVLSKDRFRYDVSGTGLEREWTVVKGGDKSVLSYDRNERVDIPEYTTVLYLLD